MPATPLCQGQELSLCVCGFVVPRPGPVPRGCGAHPPRAVQAHTHAPWSPGRRSVAVRVPESSPWFGGLCVHAPRSACVRGPCPWHCMVPSGAAARPPPPAHAQDPRLHFLPYLADLQWHHACVGNRQDAPPPTAPSPHAHSHHLPHARFRRYMEDAVCVAASVAELVEGYGDENTATCFFGVFDGHGGCVWAVVRLCSCGAVGPGVLWAAVAVPAQGVAWVTQTCAWGAGCCLCPHRAMVAKYLEEHLVVGGGSGVADAYSTPPTPPNASTLHARTHTPTRIAGPRSATSGLRSLTWLIYGGGSGPDSPPHTLAHKHSLTRPHSPPLHCCVRCDFVRSWLGT
jgi:hypothetical protein